MNSNNDKRRKKVVNTFPSLIAGQTKTTFQILHKNLNNFTEMFPPYLYGQAECVEDDENEHDVFETSGIDHIPELILVVVLWNVSPQWTGFQSVLHTLALLRMRQGKKQRK